LFLDPNPTSFDLRFRFVGVDVRVHPLFWLIMAAIGWNWGANPRLPGGGFGEVALWVACCFVSILLHEMGHIAMGRAFGADGHIVLYGFGGLAIGSNNVRQRWQRILVSLAGPGAQLLLLAAIVGLEANWQPPQGSAISLALLMLWVINLFWPLFNLLPIWPLDGGMIAREVCQGINRHRGVEASLWISLVVAALLAVSPFIPPENNPLVKLFGSDNLLVRFLVGGSKMNALFFAMFAASSFQSLQEERSRNRYGGDDDWPWSR
jgi:Zn-dependent protease